MEHILKNSIKNALSYTDYRKLVTELVSKGKSTGKEQSDALFNYSSLNDRRMKRLDKTLKVTEENSLHIKKNSKDQTWLVITESWCGDAAQTVPMIHKISEASDKIDLKVVLRDDNEDLMNKFLTNGNKAIPKLIVLDKKTNEVIQSWGPRPKTATKMVNDYKKKHGGLDPEFKEDLQKWYNKDKGNDTQDDLMSIFDISA